MNLDDVEFEAEFAKQILDLYSDIVMLNTHDGQIQIMDRDLDNKTKEF